MTIKKDFIFKIFTVLFCGFLFILPISIFALEIEYPKTVSGYTLTNTPDLSQYSKYVFEFGLSIGLAVAVLTLTISGILYFIAPISPSSLEIAKDRISGAISGLLILLLTYLIITTINPYLSIFKMGELEKVEFQISEDGVYGMNFYNSGDCSNVKKTSALSIFDLGDLKNKINSVKISQNAISKIYYIGILYDNVGYWGKCQYINPNEGCQEVKVSTASASIYEYDFYPSSSGFVSFYRKSFNSVFGKKDDNESGGYLKIPNSQIGKIYFKKLDELNFTGNGIDCTVPENEQDCIKWDNYGKCIERECPKLDKENITSIKIKGDYIVLLVYIGPDDDTRNFTYSFCQAFPTKDDANKEGPQQIKWDSIRASGYDPNYVLIIPVKNK